MLNDLAITKTVLATNSRASRFGRPRAYEDEVGALKALIDKTSPALTDARPVCRDNKPARSAAQGSLTKRCELSRRLASLRIAERQKRRSASPQRRSLQQACRRRLAAKGDLDEPWDVATSPRFGETSHEDPNDSAPTSALLADFRIQSLKLPRL